MTKIIVSRNRKEIEEVHKKLSKIDSQVIDSNIAIIGMGKYFILDRDKKLIKKINTTLEWVANNLLLLKGRITHYELGSKIFLRGNYRQFEMRKISARDLKYVKLIETNYKGKKFSKFMVQDLGAKARIGIDNRTKKEVIISVLIPVDKVKFINY